MIKQASVYQDLPPFIEAELFCYHYCTCYQRMNIKVQEKRRTCVSECIYAPTIYVYSLRHVLDRDQCVLGLSTIYNQLQTCGQPRQNGLPFCQCTNGFFKTQKNNPKVTENEQTSPQACKRPLKTQRNDEKVVENGQKSPQACKRPCKT